MCVCVCERERGWVGERDREGVCVFCENCTHSLHDLEQTPQLIDTKADLFISEVIQHT